MMAVLWVVLGIAAMLLIMTVAGIIFGRGHLGAEQTESHYLDEVESMAHTAYI